MLTKHTTDFHWENVPVLSYKEDAEASFRSITRQILFDGTGALPVQVRYFEIAAGGWSTLERHEHLHVVWIARGKGRALVGNDVIELAERDVVNVPANVWHQFRADRGEPLGFVCLVNVDRDRPHLPSGDELSSLRSAGTVKEFIRTSNE